MPPLSAELTSTDHVDASFFFDTPQAFDKCRGNNCSKAPAAPTPRVIYFGQMWLEPRPIAQTKFFAVAVTNCSVVEMRVEVAVHCTGGRGCRAVKIRESKAGIMDPQGATHFDNELIARNIFTNMPLVTTGRMPYEVSLTERVLFNTNGPPVGVTDEIKQSAYLATVAPETFSLRLTLLVNTFYRSAQPGSIGAFFGSLPADLSLYGRDFGHRPLQAGEAVLAKWCPYFCTRSTRAMLTQTLPVYRCNMLWLALLVASASVLLVFGAAATVLGWRTFVPDMLGYVASMTFNNPYLRLPAGSAELEAMDRARALRNEEVIIGDVRGAHDVGHIAFARSVGSLRRLEKGRKYT